MDLDRFSHASISLATEWWNAHPELRKSLLTQPTTSLAPSIAPRALSSSEFDLNQKPLSWLPKWIAKSDQNLMGPFRLFGEALPRITAANISQIASSITYNLTHHYNVVLFSAAAQTDLKPLTARFNIELHGLLAYLNAQEEFGLQSTSFTELAIAMETQMSLILERSTPAENDAQEVLLCSMYLHCYWIHFLSFVYNRNRECSESRELFIAHTTIIFRQWAKIGPTDLRRFSTDRSQLLPYHATSIRVISELLAVYRQFDDEVTPGVTAWKMISSTWRNLEGEAKWRLAVTMSMINSSNLDKDGPDNNEPVLYPAWDAIQELLGEDLLQKPSTRSSPIKEPSGPLKGIVDLILRIKFFSSIWQGAQSATALALIARYFADKSLWKLSTPQEFFSVPNINLLFTGNSSLDTSLELNTVFSSFSSINAFDMFLHLVHFIYTKLQTSKDAPKLKMNLVKLVELFLNVLDDFPTTGLDPNTEAPALVRNAFQLSLVLIPFMNDTDIQHILMERLFSIPLDALSLPACTTLIEGLFAILELLSTRLPPPSFEDSQMEDSMLAIYGDVGNLDIEASIVPYPGSRTRITSYMSSTVLEHLVGSYIRALSSDRKTSNTLAIQLSNSPFKRSKHLDLSDGSNLKQHEKLLQNYLQLTRKVYQNNLSNASISLLSPKLEQVLVNVLTSTSVRQYFNSALQSLVLAARKTSLDPAMRKHAGMLWIVWQRSITPTSPSQAVEQAAILQGILMFALSMESPSSSWTDVIANSAEKEQPIRCIPLWALRGWLDLLHQSLKADTYVSTVNLPQDFSVTAIAILILAFLEWTKPSSVLDTVLKIRDLATLQTVAAKKHPSLGLLSFCIFHEGFMEAVQQPMTSTNFALQLLTSVTHWNQQNSQKAIEYAPFYPILLKHVDAVILKNRNELASNPTQLAIYDEKIYPFAALCLQIVPNWLHNKSDLRYNVLGKLVTELFLVPLKGLTPIEITTPSANSAPASYVSTSSSTLSSMAASMAANQRVKTSTGMVVGMAKSSASSSNPTSGSSRSSASSRRVVKPPQNINQNAIRHLPALITGLTRLSFSYDADLQRYLSEIVVATFQSFLGGKEGGHDGRLLEQLATGLAASETILAMPDAVKSTFRNQSRDFRVFFLANIVPWLVGLIEDGPEDLFDTNSFILSRLLGWIILKLKRTPNSTLDIMKVFLMSIHWLLDLFRSRKPTKSHLAKRELLGFVSIFCSTIIKMAPTSPVVWIKGIDAIMYGDFITAMKEIVMSILRDVEYICNASWPIYPPQATLLTSNLGEHKNAVFERTADHTAHLSTLVLMNDVYGAPAEGLSELCKIHLEVLDYVRQLELTSVILDIHDRLRGLIYVPNEGSAQRQARGDIKTALETWRTGYNRISFLIKGNTS